MAKRVLVTWGSKRGGTEGIGRSVGEALAARGFDVVMKPAAEIRSLEGFDAAIVGGALYANRWHRDARRFVKRNLQELRQIPVWLFSSGPLDDTATEKDIPPTTVVSVLADRIGARGHVTFGGRLAQDARGFPASAMAKKHHGDWRNPEHIRGWTAEIAEALPDALPRLPVEPAARSVPRLLVHGFAGWALCAATMGLLMSFASTTLAIVLHAIAAPLFFIVIARHYFMAYGARDPLATAAVWTAMVIGLDVVLAGVVLRDFAMLGSFAGAWLPFALIFGATWSTGALMAMMPRKTNDEASAAAEPSRVHDDRGMGSVRHPG